MAEDDLYKEKKVLDRYHRSWFKQSDVAQLVVANAENVLVPLW